MIFKLHLTREELAFLAVAVEERQRIISYFLSQEISLEPLPFDPDPLTDAEREKMISALEGSAVIAEKIRLLSEYADRTQDVINAYRSRSDEIARARYNAMNQRRIYLKYACSGVSNIPDPEPFPDDQELEIPDPE